MRPMRTLATVLLLASLALTGCRTSQADEPTTPTARPPARTAAPATNTPAGTNSTTAPLSTGPTTRDPVCAGVQSWGTGPKQVVASPVTAEIYQVRAASHQGCDRVVFDLNGWAGSATWSAMSRRCMPTPRTGQSWWPALPPSRS
jgi:hypothetical protein